MPKYKAFISHSSKDKPFVRKLKEDLNFNGIETWVDEDELKVGDKLYDSLMLGLESSTHFLIVLSDNIQGSVWVDAEIDEAIKNFDSKNLKKIIPILLRNTDIPVKLKDLFRADFSKITFTVKDHTVHSTGDNYHKEVEKIISAINKNENFLLTSKEKDAILEKTELQNQYIIKKDKTIGLYKIVGFSTKESRTNFVNQAIRKNPNSQLTKIPINTLMPICLPSLVKQVFGKRTMGEVILIGIRNSNKKYQGHFCGYLNNNINIVIPKEIRNALKVQPKEINTVEINGITNTITIII